MDLPHEDVLSILRGLDLRNGFLGIVLNPTFTLQLIPDKRGGIEVELLDTSIPAFDLAVADFAFAEDLIKTAEEGRDVFQIARSRISEWRHIDL